MALLCTFPLFDSELLPMAYSLTFNLLALLCTPPLGGKTSCCLLPVFCLLFRFVLQGLIIKTNFFGHLSVFWKMSEWHELFSGRWAEGWESPLSQGGAQTTRFDLAHLASASGGSKPLWAKPNAAVCLLFSVAPWGRCGTDNGLWLSLGQVLGLSSSYSPSVWAVSLLTRYWAVRGDKRKTPISVGPVSCQG